MMVIIYYLLISLTYYLFIYFYSIKFYSYGKYLSLIASSNVSFEDFFFLPENLQNTAL